MIYKEQSLTSISGTFPGKLSYAPRFDLWFNAHQCRGTLPTEYQHCTTPLDIARILGVGGHIVVPDFIRPEEPPQMFDRGIGIYNLPQIPYHVKLKNVERTVIQDDYATKTTYRTPKGTLRVSYELTKEMHNAGASISWITEHAFKDERDYEPLIFLFENLEVESSYSGLRIMIDSTGEDAFVVANGAMAGSPMQFIMRDLIEMTPFYMEMIDRPEKLKALADAIGSFFEQIIPASSQCPAEVILFGANMDETITYPPFYEEHILPWIARFAELAHKHGKYVFIHADGENQSLFDLYRQSGIDILEAVATSPMTKSDIHEVLEKTEGMTVWGGIPSVVLMPDTCDDKAFESFMAETLEAVNGRPRFILGVSDTTPPEADFGRLIRIRDMIG